MDNVLHVKNIECNCERGISQSEITDTLHKCQCRKHARGDDKPVKAQQTEAEEGKVCTTCAVEYERRGMVNILENFNMCLSYQERRQPGMLKLSRNYYTMQNNIL